MSNKSRNIDRRDLEDGVAPFTPALATAFALAGFGNDLPPDDEPVVDATVATDPTALPIADDEHGVFVVALAEPAASAPEAAVLVEVITAPAKPAPKPKAPHVDELSDNAVWDEVPFKQFDEFDTGTLSVLVRAIRANGKRPVVSFGINVERAHSRIDFGLEVVSGKHGERVKMTVLGGVGHPLVLFARCSFFRDELFGHTEAPKARFASTRGLKGYLEMALSIMGVR